MPGPTRMTKIQTLAKRMATKTGGMTRPRPAYGGKVRPKRVGGKRRRRRRRRQKLQARATRPDRKQMIKRYPRGTKMKELR